MSGGIKLVNNDISKCSVCGHVFHVTRNESIIYSECPFGMIGLQDEKNRLNYDCKKEECFSCTNFIDRKIRIPSVDEASKTNYINAKLTEIMTVRLLNKKQDNQSYLYNDIMIDYHDEEYFKKQCQNKKSQKSQDDEKGRKIRFTDIY